MLDPIAALKTQLGAVISERVSGWRRADIAAQAQISLADVSRLRACQLDRFSLASLIRVARGLGFDVELRVTRRSAGNRYEKLSTSDEVDREGRG